VDNPIGRVTFNAAVGGLGADMPGGGVAPKAFMGTPGAVGLGGKLIRMVSFFNLPCPFRAAVPAAAKLIVSLGMAEVGTVPGRWGPGKAGGLGGNPGGLGAAISR
jgi:hypothetical protein